MRLLDEASHVFNWSELLPPTCCVLHPCAPAGTKERIMELHTSIPCAWSALRHLHAVLRGIGVQQFTVQDAHTASRDFVHAYRVIAGKERRVFDYLHILGAHLVDQLTATQGELYKMRCEGMEALHRTVKKYYHHHTTRGARGDRCAVGDVMERLHQDQALVAAVANARAGLIRANWQCVEANA